MKINTLNIIIDSTELKKDRGLNKANLSLIKDMGAEDLIKLHIPYFVYKECTTSSIADLSKELKQIKSNLNSFDRKGMGQSDFLKANEIQKEISKLEKNVEQSNFELWDVFISESKAILYDYDEKDSIAVFEAYFTGEKPFKSLKKRDDIPDAFIFETIKKICSKNEVFLISADKNLVHNCSTLMNVKIFPSFEVLYDNSDFKALQVKYNKLKYNQRVSNARLTLLDNLDSFEDAVHSYASSLTHLHLENTGLPSDNGEVNIYSIDVDSITIDEPNIRFIDDKFFVPIIVLGQASIDYAMFIQDYWLEDDLPSVSEIINDHYYLLEDSVPIKLTKDFRIELNQINDDDILEIEIDEFDKIEIE